MSNASNDLTFEEFKEIGKLVARRFSTSSYIVSVGSLSKTTCLLHNVIHRSYGIGTAWQHDFCYPCFSRDISNRNFGRITGAKKK